MRRFICAALAALYLTIPALAVETLPEDSFSLSCTAAVLMERQTGTVLYEKEAHRHLSPASVTKRRRSRAARSRRTIPLRRAAGPPRWAAARSGWRRAR